MHESVIQKKDIPVIDRKGRIFDYLTGKKIVGSRVDRDNKEHHTVMIQEEISVQDFIDRGLFALHFSSEMEAETFLSEVGIESKTIKINNQNGTTLVFSQNDTEIIVAMDPSRISNFGVNKQIFEQSTLFRNLDTGFPEIYQKQLLKLRDACWNTISTDDMQKKLIEGFSIHELSHVAYNQNILPTAAIDKNKWNSEFFFILHSLNESVMICHELLTSFSIDNPNVTLNRHAFSFRVLKLLTMFNYNYLHRLITNKSKTTTRFAIEHKHWIIPETSFQRFLSPLLTSHNLGFLYLIADTKKLAQSLESNNIDISSLFSNASEILHRIHNVMQMNDEDVINLIKTNYDTCIKKATELFKPYKIKHEKITKTPDTTKTPNARENTVGKKLQEIYKKIRSYFLN